MSLGPAPAPVTAENPPSDEGGATGGPGPRPRWRTIAVWTVVALVLTALVVVVAGGRAPSDQPLDPDNPRDAGTRGVVRVLEQQGVDVTVVRDQDALLGQRLGPDTTLVVSRTQQLTPGTGSTALQHAAEAAGVVLLDAGPALPQTLDLPATGTMRPGDGVLAAECDSPLVRPGDTLSGVEVLFRSSAPGAAPCFPPNATFNTGGASAGHLLHLPRDSRRPPVLLVGAPDAFSNERITEQSHAGIALRALGQSPRLVWYVATISDGLTEGSSTDFYGQLPPHVLPGLTLLGAAVLALMLWRGRRLGRLVSEPLPVVVRAVETTESRGRLYRAANDRERALAALQAATRRRLAARLGLAPGTGPQELTEAVLRAGAGPSADGGRSHDQVARLLHDPSAADDAALLHTATQLASLEEEVRRR